MSDSIKVKPGIAQGSVRIPLSKSYLHRALICAALAGDMKLANLGQGELSVDIEATKACLVKLLDDDSEPVVLNCHESGSTLRFLIPLAAALGRSCTFIGRGRLPFRPLGEYQRILPESGVAMIFAEEGGACLPLAIEGQLQAGVFALPGNVSSQYITGLLLALPLLVGDSQIVLTSPLESEPYVDITIRVMAEFGVAVEKTERGYRIPGGQKYIRSHKYDSEADYSQAAFWLLMKYLGHPIVIANLPPENSVQGDKVVKEILAKMEALSDSAGGCFSEKGDPSLEVDLSQCPDLAPALAVAAAATPCVTRFVNAGRLRIKECDRLSASCEMLGVLGIETREEEDSFVVFGTRVRVESPGFSGGIIRKYEDHRMVMASAVAATCAREAMEIDDYQAVWKSYPNFFEVLAGLGIAVEKGRG